MTGEDRRFQPRSNDAGLKAALLVALMAWPTAAEAKDPRRNPALAEELFARGRDLLAAGKMEEACKAFEASQAADASVGALLNLAQCHEKQSRLATAWAEYRSAATLAAQRGEDERRRGALERASQIEARLPRLTVDVSPQQADVVVYIGGQALPAMSYGLPMPVDPGEYVVTARAPEHLPWRTSITIEPTSAGTTVVVPPLVDSSLPSLAPLEPPRPIRRTVGFIVGGVGVAGFLVGVVQGGRAFAMDRDLDRMCAPIDPSGKRACGVDKADAIEDLRVTAAMATGLLAAGAILGVGGGVLVLTAPEPASASVAISPRLGPEFRGVEASVRF